MASPYPWHYSLRWPLYFRFPSTRNHTRLPAAPIRRDFFAAADPVRVLFGGDIMVMQRDTIPQLHPALVALLRNADMVVMNCEAPVGDQARDPQIRYRFNFHMPRACLAGILAQVTDSPANWLLSVANNHAGDRGHEAFLRSMAIFEEMGIRTAGRWYGFADPLHCAEIRGLRLGFASWTHWLNCPVFPSRDRGVNRTEDVLRSDWQVLRRSNGIDALIGLPHWEFEFQHFPRSSTRALADELAGQGFDLLIGAHPHTLQPMEWFGSCLCQYSLGNFCGLGVAWSVKLIPLLEVRLEAAGPNRGKVAGYTLHPFVQRHAAGEVSIVPLLPELVPNYKDLSDRLNLLFSGFADGAPEPASTPLANTNSLPFSRQSY